MMDPISEEWLREVGFKWHQLERQTEKHWLLWLAGAFQQWGTDVQDLGIELASGAMDGAWFCWLRSDTARLYGRFIHVRHLRYQQEVRALVEAITGQKWDVQNHIYGSVLSPQSATRIRAEWDRLDRKLLREGPKWHDIEKDDSRGGALPEHLRAHEESKSSK